MLFKPQKIILASLIFVAGFATLTGCSSAPNANDPAWTKASGRTVDNGYIVYVESVGASDGKRARFLAEAQALMDLRNECTLIPKGTRIEDYYERKDSSSSSHEVFVKVGVEFQECENAKRAVTVDEVQKIANVPMTEEVKRLEEEQKAPDATALASNEESITPPQMSSTAGGIHYASNDVSHYYIMREQIAEEKQYVVLQPVYAYAPAALPTSPPPAVPAMDKKAMDKEAMDKEAINQRLAQHTANVQQFEAQHPEVKTQTRPWSQVRTQLVRNYKTNVGRAKQIAEPHPQPQHQAQPARKQQPHRRRGR